MTATITIGVDPTIQVGPLALEWHGLTIAIGIICGGLVAVRWARERGLGGDPIYTIGILVALGGLVGGRLFYVLEHGGPLLDDRGFTFDGGLILATLLIAGYVRRAGLSARYLDASAVGLPLGWRSAGSAMSSTVSTTGRAATSSWRCATPTPTR